MKTKSMSALREVHIDIGKAHVVAWEPKEASYRTLGRWTDPKALLQRIYELEHPDEAQNTPEGPGRQWQATWRGRFSPAKRNKTRTAA